MQIKKYEYENFNHKESFMWITQMINVYKFSQTRKKTKISLIMRIKTKIFT